jgi:hypothetical protein
MNWRDRCKPMIAQVLAENRGKPLNELRRVLRESFPFGARKMHPYKIWLSECRQQLMAAECLPPGFRTSHFRDRVALEIMADWWEERGDLPRARMLRNTKVKRQVLAKGERRSVAVADGQRSLFADEVTRTEGGR